jgi:hypothetical protein
VISVRKPQIPSLTTHAQELANSLLSRHCQSSLIVVLGLLLGCSRPLKTPVASEFNVEVHAESDYGAVLQGVEIYANRQPMGRTNDAGRLSFRLFGIEGQSVPIDWGCPEGHVAPAHAQTIRLAHTKSVAVGTPQPLKLEAVCPRRTREVVVVVHADQGNAIPVLIDGKIASVTSSDGFAQVLLNVDRSIRSIAVGLDTTSRPNLKPKNPSRKYDLSNNDSILILDQKFTALQPARAIIRKESRHIPYRVD